MDLFDKRFFVGIVGSRRRDSTADLIQIAIAFGIVLTRYKLIEEQRQIVIVSGGCPQGGDRFAELIANTEQHAILLHRPDKTAFAGEQNPRLRATKQNYARNSLIARDSRDVLIACVANDRKGGTEDTIQKYEAMYKREAILV